MATYNKFNSFVEALAEKAHNLGSDTLAVALSNTAPAAGNSVLGDIVQIDYTNLPGSRALTTTSSSQTNGAYSLVVADKVLTATGPVPTFRYVVVYNDSAAADELICWYDYGAGGVTLANGETFTIDFGANLLTLA
jgi:hypothetical protein